METIHFVTTVPADRMLSVRVPEWLQDGEIEVTVLLEPRAASRSRATRKGWQEIVHASQGCLRDTPLTVPADVPPEPVDAIA